jgi:hypothetical protein
LHKIARFVRYDVLAITLLNYAGKYQIYKNVIWKAIAGGKVGIVVVIRQHILCFIPATCGERDLLQVSIVGEVYLHVATKGALSQLHGGQ